MIPKEAISKADFDRQERGQPPIVKAKIIREDPKPPVVPDEIKFEQVPTDEIFEFNARMRRGVKNEDGVHWTGYDVYLESRKGKILEGWMCAGEFEKLRQRIKLEAPALLLNIAI